MFKRSWVAIITRKECLKYERAARSSLTSVPQFEHFSSALTFDVVLDVMISAARAKRPSLCPGDRIGGWWRCTRRALWPFLLDIANLDNCWRRDIAGHNLRRLTRVSVAVEVCELSLSVHLLQLCHSTNFDRRKFKRLGSKNNKLYL